MLLVGWWEVPRRLGFYNVLDKIKPVGRDAAILSVYCLRGKFGRDCVAKSRMLREEFYISCSFHLLAMFLTTRSVLEYLVNEGMFIIILNHAEWRGSFSWCLLVWFCLKANNSPISVILRPITNREDIYLNCLMQWKVVGLISKSKTVNGVASYKMPTPARAPAPHPPLPRSSAPALPLPLSTYI